MRLLRQNTEQSFPSEQGCSPVGPRSSRAYHWVSVGLGSLLFTLVVAAAPESVIAAEPVIKATFSHPAFKEDLTVEGKIIVTAQDGGILLLGRDGQLWNITPKQLTQREDTDREFSPFSMDEIAVQVQKELGFQLIFARTKHFLIASGGADLDYAEWCGQTFESLYKGFFDFCRTQKIDLHEPEFPLVALVFPNKTLFAEHAFKQGGEQARDSHGYYWVLSNRIVLYDLTADGSSPTASGKKIDIHDRMQTSAYNVATIVHEATHQIAFNCGLHTRLADNPLWLTEGLAMYCETPDLKSRTGWRTIGALNKQRLRTFQNFVRQRRKPDSLATLISDGKRFASDPQQTGETYAEAWALTYFLIKKHPKEYAEFLQRISKKEPLIFGAPDATLKEFQKVFGEDLQQLDREFLQFARRLPAR